MVSNDMMGLRQNGCYHNVGFELGLSDSNM